MANNSSLATKTLAAVVLVGAVVSYNMGFTKASQSERLSVLTFFKAGSLAQLVPSKTEKREIPRSHSETNYFETAPQVNKLYENQMMLDEHTKAFLQITPVTEALGGNSGKKPPIAVAAPSASCSSSSSISSTERDSVSSNTTIPTQATASQILTSSMAEPINFDHVAPPLVGAGVIVTQAEKALLEEPIERVFRNPFSSLFQQKSTSFASQNKSGFSDSSYGYQNSSQVNPSPSIIQPLDSSKLQGLTCENRLSTSFQRGSISKTRSFDSENSTSVRNSILNSNVRTSLSNSASNQNKS